MELMHKKLIVLAVFASVLLGGAFAQGRHQRFDFGFVKVEAVEAGYNRMHNPSECVGYILTFENGASVYVTGDTSRTPQMASLSQKQIDYAFFCCDGVYNMDDAEAARCADLVGAKHSIPYHNIAAGGDVYFDAEKAAQFPAKNLLVINPGEEIELH